MWDYRDIPRKREALMALSQVARDALTWEGAVKFLRHDTLAIARWTGLRRRKEGCPFDAVCRANGFEPCPAPSP